MVLDKVKVLEWYDDWIVHSARWQTRVPAVIMLNDYQKPKHTMSMSKRNVFLRDANTPANTAVQRLQKSICNTRSCASCESRAARPLGKILQLPARAVTTKRLLMWAR
jgi:hypothetical protein